MTLLFGVPVPLDKPSDKERMATGPKAPEAEARDGGDEALAIQAQAGDIGAFRRLYERYAPIISRRLRRILWRVSDVEDVLQMTFLEVHRALPRYQPDRPFGAWVHGVAFRVAGTHLRTQRRRSWFTRGPEFDEEHLASDLVAAADDHAGTQALLRDAVRGIAALTEKKRIALLLHELEGLSMAEIAAMLDESPQTINARVQSARLEVRQSIERAQNLRKSQPPKGGAR